MCREIWSQFLINVLTYLCTLPDNVPPDLVTFDEEDEENQRRTYMTESDLQPIMVNSLEVSSPSGF